MELYKFGVFLWGRDAAADRRSGKRRQKETLELHGHGCDLWVLSFIHLYQPGEFENTWKGRTQWVKGLHVACVWMLYLMKPTFSFIVEAVCFDDLLLDLSGHREHELQHFAHVVAGAFSGLLHAGCILGHGEGLDNFTKNNWNTHNQMYGSSIFSARQTIVTLKYLNWVFPSGWRITSHNSEFTSHKSDS